jgi:hypothetical protein
MNEWGYTLGDFLTNASGHPGSSLAFASQSQVRAFVCVSGIIFALDAKVQTRESVMRII